jgi:hypothetical protein
MADDKKYKYLTAQVDVPIGGDAPPSAAGQPANPKPTKRVGPGLLSELDLTDEQIEKLPRGVVRSATADEIRAGDTAAQTKASREIQQRALADQRDASIETQTERQRIIDDFERQKNEALAKFDAQSEQERAEAASRTTEELNKAAQPSPQEMTRRPARTPVNTRGGDQGTTAGGAASTTEKAPGTAQPSAPSAAPVPPIPPKP